MASNNDSFPSSLREPDSFSGDKGYALSGKIMLSAIIILFFVVLLMFSLHLYARWFVLRARRRNPRHRHRHSRRTHIVFYIDTDANPIVAASRGLNERVLRSLPVFTFSSKTHPDSALECAVCLSEFEDDEKGRTLPKCNHSFHTECIDMWFLSHSTCPLCRSPVELAPESPGDVVLTVTDPPTSHPGPGTNLELCDACQHEEQAGTSTLVAPTKLSIEVPRRNGAGFEGESSGCDSGSQSFRSPMSRMLSFKRILSRERRQSPSPSPRNAIGCAAAPAPVAESDLERGGDETRQTQG